MVSVGDRKVEADEGLTSFLQKLVEFDGGSGLRTWIRKGKRDQTRARTLKVKPWDTMSSSAPMNRRKCLAEGIRDSPTWYLEKDHQRRRDEEGRC